MIYTSNESKIDIQLTDENSDNCFVKNEELSLKKWCGNVLMELSMIHFLENDDRNIMLQFPFYVSQC